MYFKKAGFSTNNIKNNYEILAKFFKSNLEKIFKEWLGSYSFSGFFFKEE